MLEIIGAVLKLLLLVLPRWFKFSDDQKIKAKKILKEVPGAVDISSITRAFDNINSL